MPRWLHDKSGSYMVEAIVSVRPLEMRADKRDQTKITSTLAEIGMAGGQVFHTEAPFADVLKLIDPPKSEPVSSSETGSPNS